MPPPNSPLKPAHVSPSLRTGSSPPALAPSYELKFLLPVAAAAEVEAWARASLQPDPHGVAALGGAYEVTTLYLDTPRHDVFFRAPELDGAKLRLRRYGAEDVVYLEQKRRRGDVVEKRRTKVRGGEVARLEGAVAPDWAGAWFRGEVDARGFRPMCNLTYLRTAYFGSADHGGFRLTLDRGVRAAKASAWEARPAGAAEGIAIGATETVCELKFRNAMPQPFKALVARLGLASSGLSKYRRACVAGQFIPGVKRDA